MGSYFFKAVSVIIYNKTQKNTVHFFLMYQPKAVLYGKFRAQCSDPTIKSREPST